MFPRSCFFLDTKVRTCQVARARLHVLGCAAYTQVCSPLVNIYKADQLERSYLGMSLDLHHRDKDSCTSVEPVSEICTDDGSGSVPLLELDSVGAN